MIAPLVIAPPTIDPGVAIARELAGDRWAAAPVDRTGWTYRTGESLDDLKARVKNLEVAEGPGFRALRRADRPLLLPYRARFGTSDLAHVFGRLLVLSGRARRDVFLKSLPAVDRETIAEAFGPDAMEQAGADAQLLPTVGIGLVHVPPGDESTIYSATFPKATPFDPEPARSRFDVPEPPAMPPALRERLAKSPPPEPGTRSLGEWTRAYPFLVVDARARNWRVALQGSGDAAAGLEAIASASRLWFRPLGERWFLAASPEDPRRFGVMMDRRKARAAAFSVLAPMARSGEVPEDLFAMIADGPTVDPDRHAERVERLLALPEARFRRYDRQQGVWSDDPEGRRVFLDAAPSTVRSTFTGDLEMLGPGTSIRRGVSFG